MFAFGPKLAISEQYVPFTDRNAEQNSLKCPIVEQTVPFTDRNSEHFGDKWPNWEHIVLFTDGNSEKTVLDFSIHRWQFLNYQRRELGTKQS